MKNFFYLSVLFLALVNICFAQTDYRKLEESFTRKYVKPADLIVEATVVSYEYIRDTSLAVEYLYPHSCSTSYSNAVWYIKYNLQVQKVFKGSVSITNIAVIDMNMQPNIHYNGKDILLNHRISPDSRMKNFYPDMTGIFFLKQLPDSISKYGINTFYFNYTTWLGGYERIGVSYFPRIYVDGQLSTEFTELIDLYEFIERSSGTKMIDITHKKFQLDLTYEKKDAYLIEILNDSLGSKEYQKKLTDGSINQLNIESYRVKPSAPDTAKQRNEQLRRDSINRVSKEKFLEIQELKKERDRKRGPSGLKKSGETLTIEFASFIDTREASPDTARLHAASLAKGDDRKGFVVRKVL